MMMLSPIFTVLLFTDVVVPFTVKSPLNIKLAAFTVPVNVGPAENTRLPEPVSSVTTAIKLALVGVAKKVATPDAKPDTPVLMGRPVQFVNVPDVGVPKMGVTNVGLVLKTLLPLPVDVVTPVPPLATGNVPVTPVDNGSPVAFVNVILVGVPKAPP
jgi:hypothetical protein